MSRPVILTAFLCCIWLSVVTCQSLDSNLRPESGKAAASAGEGAWTRILSFLGLEQVGQSALDHIATPHTLPAEQHVEGHHIAVADSDDLEFCKPPYKTKKQVCKAKLSDLRPTQNSIGSVMVDCKVESLKQKDDLDEYIKTHALETVAGPGGTLFLIDGHHKASALYRLNGSTDLIVHVYIKEDLSHLPDMEVFWRRMELSKWVWTSDKMGHPIDPSNLPDSLEGVANDPYRSLAALLREYGYFKKSRFAPFAEFYWSDYMRMFFGSYVCVSEMTQDEEVKWLTEITKPAGKLATEKRAAHLPGWGKGKKKGDFDCSLFKNDKLSLFSE